MNYYKLFACWIFITVSSLKGCTQAKDKSNTMGPWQSDSFYMPQKKRQRTLIEGRESKSKVSLQALVGQEISKGYSAHVRIGTHTLLEAIRKKNNTIIPSLLLHRGVNALARLDDYDASTILHWVVKMGNIEQAVLLITYLASNSNRLISKAIQQATPKLSLPNYLADLIALYSDSVLNIQDRWGKTPLDLSVPLSPLATLLKQSGAMYSHDVLEDKIKGVFGPYACLPESLVYQLCEQGDTEALYLTLCHPSVHRVYVNKYLVTDFRKPMDLAESLVREYCPPWRLIKSEINVKAFCENESCSCYKDGMYIPIPFRSRINVAELFFSEQFPNCPCCNTPVSVDKLVGIAFKNCWGEIKKGILKDPNGLRIRSNSHLVKQKFDAINNIYYESFRNNNELYTMFTFELKRFS